MKHCILAVIALGVVLLFPEVSQAQHSIRGRIFTTSTCTSANGEVEDPDASGERGISEIYLSSVYSPGTTPPGTGGWLARIEVKGDYNAPITLPDGVHTIYSYMRNRDKGGSFWAGCEDRGGPSQCAPDGMGVIIRCSGGNTTPAPTIPPGATATPTPILGACSPVTTFPTNLQSTCNFTGNTQTISWANDTNASAGYSLRIDSSTDNYNWNTGVCPPAVTGPGDHCVDLPAGTTTYTFSTNVRDTYLWWIHSRDSCTPSGFGTGVYGPAMRCIPNCSNIWGPANIQIGTSGTFFADFESLDSNLGAEIFHSNFNRIRFASLPGTQAPMTASWSPTATGTFNVCCRAWNDAKTECQPSAVLPADAPPIYQCAGPNTCTTVTVTDIQEWYKMRDTSFHRQGNFNMTIPNTMQRYADTDPDDTNDQFPIIGTAGVVTASGGSMNITSASGFASNREWQARSFTDDNNFLTNLPAFVDYARARKNAQIITGVDQIQVNRINIINGNVDIFDFNVLPNIGDYILIVNGDLSFGTPAPLINPAQNGVAFIVTGTINVDSAYSELNGIFIANNFNLASNIAAPGNGTVPLKINGNLISRTPINAIRRERTDFNRPSLFIVARPQMYIDLLPLLSIIAQEGRQIE